MAEFKKVKYKINYKDIKSSYILERVFSFLNEKEILNMIIYNKELQKMFLIDIEDYKKISRIYKIYEKKGKGKEYLLSTNILIFEGEYLNGRRNGKGKEYYTNGKLKFEGKYINGKKWDGKGYNLNGNMEFIIKDGIGKNIKEYSYYDDILEFEGEYLNGRRNGKGKEYYKDGKLLFEGEYLNGKKWDGNGYNINGNMEFIIKNGKGYIKEYDYKGRLEYEGEYINGERNGIGKEYDSDDDKLEYEGNFFNGKRNGKGKEYYKNGKLLFEGEYLNGKKWNGNGYNVNGKIEFSIKVGKGNIKEYDNYNGRLIFEGEYLNGARNGKGKEYDFYRKLKFEGEYLNGKRNGKGKEYYTNGNLKFEGEYLNEKKWNGNGYNINGNKEFELKDGKGNIKEYEFFDKLVFEGEYLNGKRNGKGKEFDYFDGKLEYEGQYLNGERNGIGKEYDSNGKLEYEGQYLIGKRNGKGKEYYTNGKLNFEGEYFNGKKWNGNGYNIQGKEVFKIKDGKGKITEYNHFDGSYEYE